MYTMSYIYKVVAHGRVITSSSQSIEFKQRRAWLVLGWVTGARDVAGHVFGKPPIQCRLCPPSSDGYLVE